MKWAEATDMVKISVEATTEEEEEAATTMDRDTVDTVAMADISTTKISPLFTDV